MRIIQYIAQQYTLPLAGPLTTGSQDTFRKGIVLTLCADTGLKGCGEIAPLPGLHKETLPEAAGQLQECLPYLSQVSVSNDMLCFDGSVSQALPSDLLPSVQCGIETAIFDLLLQANPNVCDLSQSIPINGLLVADDRTLMEKVDILLSQGFSSIKIKVARQTLEQDIKDVSTALSRVKGKALLRLDANRQWSLDQAKRFCDAIDLEGVEYIEEPTQAPADHIQLTRHKKISIALDETLSNADCDQLDPATYRAVVLKPSVLGGLDKTARMIRWAQTQDILPVISSAFQTSLTNRMYLFFAALNQITQTPLGLDTAKWFRQDVLSNPFVIKNGNVSLASLKARPDIRQEFLLPLEGAC